VYIEIQLGNAKLLCLWYEHIIGNVSDLNTEHVVSNITNTTTENIKEVNII